MTQVILKPNKEQSLHRFHPWVFSGAIQKLTDGITEGDLVDIYSYKNEFLARGFYQKGSIAVKVLSFKKEPIDADFWRDKLKKAYNLRIAIGLANNPITNAFRLINAEGDGLPGLIIDFYNGTAVMQIHAVGMYKIRTLIAKLLGELLKDKLVAVYDKSEATLFERTASQNTYLMGTPLTQEILEYNHPFKIDWVDGQKTGFFIDQRESRQLVASYAKNNVVLNLFSYTGGFSVYALHGGARHVDSVDSSRLAIDLANENIALNFANTARHQGIVAKAFNFFETAQEHYDLVILDPPAFSKHQSNLQNALNGYKRLNQKALEKIKSGGILFTFSCSQAVSRAHFRQSVFVAAANVKRSVKILHQISQPTDHPISLYHPEGEYLKGLVLQVD